MSASRSSVSKSSSAARSMSMVLSGDCSMVCCWNDFVLVGLCWVLAVVVMVPCKNIYFDTRVKKSQEEGPHNVGDI